MCRLKLPGALLRLLLAVSLLLPRQCAGGRSDRGAMDALADWCASAPAVFAVAGVTPSSEVKARAAAAGRCYMLAAKDATEKGRMWRHAGESCRGRPDLPPGVVGHLALVPSDWLAGRLVELLVPTTATCPWVGLRHADEGDGAPAAGWYHEPHSAVWSPHLRTFAVSDAAVPTPWDEAEPSGAYAACLQISNKKLKNYGNMDSRKKWICEYYYGPTTPHRFYKVPGAGDQWPVQSAQITAGGVRERHIVSDCGRLCAADRFCAGFAVSAAARRCVTAYEVYDTAARVHKAGYEVYEKVHVAL